MDDRLARLAAEELEHLELKPLTPDELRARAPGVVTSQVTYERATMRPAPGGLFDEAIFGPGESLAPPLLDEEALVTEPRAIRFGRILLGETIEHPLCGPVSELPVLPPLLRPIFRREGELFIDDRNLRYREVLVHAGRLAKLREVRAPAELLEHTRLALTTAVHELLDHRRSPDEDDSVEPPARELSSLAGLLIPTPSTAVAALDRAVGAGLRLDQPLALRWHRMVAALFALGLTVRRVSKLH